MAKVITTILLDGNPKGLRLIEVANWPGKAFVVPRNKLKELRSREDAGQPGIYVLFGEGEENPTAYIGQSENVVDRLFSHDSNREEDEWSFALVVVGNLDSTFIKYLESISLDLAKRVRRYQIFNNATPRENTLSEAQKIIALEYFDNIKTIASLCGYPIFEDPKENKESNEFYRFSTDKADARGYLLDSGEFVVLKDSIFRKRETDSFSGSSSSALRFKLKDSGLLKDKDQDSYELTQDYVFSSPSAAAASVSGRACNGWTAWKDKEDNTLDENVRK